MNNVNKASSNLIKIVSKLDFVTLFDNFSGVTSLFIGTIVISRCFYSAVKRPLLKFLNNPARCNRGLASH